MKIFTGVFIGDDKVPLYTLPIKKTNKALPDLQPSYAGFSILLFITADIYPPVELMIFNI